MPSFFKRRRFFVVAVCLVVVVFVVYNVKEPTNRRSVYYSSRQTDSLYKDHATSKHDTTGNAHGNSSGFLVNTPYCKIPDVDPFDSTIKQFVHATTPVKCEGSKDITYQLGNKLVIDKEAAAVYYNGDIKQCCYQPFGRHGNDDRTFAYDLEKTCFNDSVSINKEFVRVFCYNANDKEVYHNFHSFIVRKPDIEEIRQKQHKHHMETDLVAEKLNVLVIGIDSVSRLNFIRQMPKTRGFLMNNLNAVELQGYNKVADNTFINIVPMFTGKYVEELPWDEKLSMQPFDPYPMAWKNFSSRGYRTMFAEDFPKIAIFNYLKFGFKLPPTDYYYRPFSLAMAYDNSVWRSKFDCVGSRLETSIVLDYVYDFSKEFKNEPNFGFTFITRLTHNDINKAGSADQPHVEFLQKMKNDGLLNNTVLFYISDHGMRYGGIVSTYIGKLEERLPTMYVSLPDWFHNKYPQIASNLQTNAHRLTTPFDIYATFIDLINFDGKSSVGDVTNRGISLLKEIPVERTCEHASVLPHWCTCQTPEVVDTSTKEVQNIGIAVVHYINKQTEKYKPKCVELHMDNITDAMKTKASEKVLTFKQSLHDVIDRKVYFGSRARGALINYLLTVKVSPGGGLFEATVRFKEQDGSVEVLGDISRINKYGDQSHCIDNHTLKKYCFCKEQL